MDTTPFQPGRTDPSDQVSTTSGAFQFEVGGVPVADSALELLHERTEGWAAGLRMAALSLARHPDHERFAAEFSGSERSVAEYLLDEVLDQFPDEVRSLLLRTSVLERVSGALADRLTGGSDGDRILTELEQAGAFVVALDPQRSWFRYHRLFADLLALELRRTASDELPGLHTAAAQWFAEHGHPVEAIRHAQSGENWGFAARLLADHWFGFFLDGDWASAREILAAFPAKAVAADPELQLVAAADELTDGSPGAAEGHLKLAARELAAVPEDRREQFEVTRITLRLAVARARNDLTAVGRGAQELLLPAESGAVDAARARRAAAHAGADAARDRRGLDGSNRRSRTAPRADGGARSADQPSAAGARGAGAPRSGDLSPLDGAWRGAQQPGGRASAERTAGARTHSGVWPTLYSGA